MITETKKNLSKGMFICLMLLTLCLGLGLSAVRAQAATGFVTESGKTYYYDEDGTKHTGWLELDGNRYYFKKTGVMVKGWAKTKLSTGEVKKRFFNKKTGIMLTGFFKSSKGKIRYFDPETGYMVTGLVQIGDYYYDFDTSTGFAKQGFITYGSKKRYFVKSTGQMLIGWYQSSSGIKRYFIPKEKIAKTGYMATGFTKIDGVYYYFKKKTGKMLTGWKENKAKSRKYYFDPETGAMAVGYVTIDGVTYEFSTAGVLIGEVQETDGSLPDYPGSEKTLKNYLLGALQPVGKVLYIWGGGHEAGYKGLSTIWTDWYAKWYTGNAASYDYNSYRDLTVENRKKGLDCSGFVGWAAYQIMEKFCTVVSGDVGSLYSGYNWGTTLNQNYLSSHSYTLKPGDIGYNSGHVWIVIGQCADKSAVIVHSTPQAGVQIAGTTIPGSSNYNSQAQTLAAKYMKNFPGYVANKDYYKPSVGNYIQQYGFFRWNRSTLADPEGYCSMTADEILADLFA